MLVERESSVDDLVKNLPQLKFVILTQNPWLTFGANNDTDCELREIGSTIVVSEKYMHSQDVNIVRKVKDLITIDHSAYLALFAYTFQLDPTFITFLVKEIKLDINYRYAYIRLFVFLKVNNLCRMSQQPQYRPGGTEYKFHNATFHNAISSFMFRACEQYGVPIKRGSDNLYEHLKLLLSLGADPNSIEMSTPNQSVLTPIPHGACIQLLLDYGLDIHQLETKSITQGVQGPNSHEIEVVTEKQIPRYFALLERKMPSKSFNMQV